MPETAEPNPVPAPEDAPPIAEIASARLSELEAAAAQAAEFRERHLRAVADLENYRKRAAREREDAVKFANERLFQALLPVLDSFELGLESAAKSTDAAAIAQGMTMAVNQLHGALREHGVEPVDAHGQPFNPHLHEAISYHVTGEHEEGTVIQQIRRGYMLKDRLLRPASVIVAKTPETPVAPEAP